MALERAALTRPVVALDNISRNAYASVYMTRYRLREARRRVGLTQARLAAMVGLPQSYISRLETSEIANPTTYTVERLELALRLPPGGLQFGQPPQLVRRIARRRKRVAA